MEKDKKMYYLYHIPGKKIGMTCNIYNRIIKEQGYKPGEFEILASSGDKDVIEIKEKQWQSFFKYKKDIDNYTDSKNNPINNPKYNKIMYVNVTNQTVTFPVPIKNLKQYLEKGLGTKFTTDYGEYIIDDKLITVILNNARESMYRTTSCYIYNKILFEKTKEKENYNSKLIELPNLDNPSNVYDLIRQWASDRGIYTSGDSKTQYTKLCEESGELARAILKKDRAELIDAIGDMVVVLTNLAALEGLKIEDCVTSAYDVIKSRQGKMENGTFVKQTL
jgi:NTP pyrophosphatase (non-canonical NTP hydrolase)